MSRAVVFLTPTEVIDKRWQTDLGFCFVVIIVFYCRPKIRQNSLKIKDKKSTLKSILNNSKKCKSKYWLGNILAWKKNLASEHHVCFPMPWSEETPALSL